jgi:hypothetical protein
MIRLLIAALSLWMGLGIGSAFSAEYPESTPEIRRWFQSLMQPDAPWMSCCGEADAYYADTVIVEGDKVFAVITDERPDEPLGRMPVPVGTKIEIPPNKLKFDKGNPTGHAIVFLTRSLIVMCFVQGSGT